MYGDSNCAFESHDNYATLLGKAFTLCDCAVCDGNTLPLKYRGLQTRSKHNDNKLLENIYDVFLCMQNDTKTRIDLICVQGFCKRYVT